MLTLLEGLRFGSDDLAFLEETGLFTSEFLDRLERLEFRGEVWALPEGTPLFPQEPLLEITGPILEAQIVQTLVLNQIHFQTLVASKASRCVEAARSRRLVDFSLRRTPGGEAGLKVARASYLAGFDATSNVLAGRAYGIEIAGTMAHSFVQCFGDETEALRAFARSYPEAVLLVRHVRHVEGTRRAIEVAWELAPAGRLRGIRLDSGDLVELSREARRLLDEAGLTGATIFASGGIDENELERLLAAEAPIDGFGIGTKLGVVADAPYLDMAYKLVAFDGEPRMKLSEGKATLPGPKQVWRVERDGVASHDVLDLAGENHEGERRLVSVLDQGRRVVDEPLAVIRERARRALLALPPGTRELDAAQYDVRFGSALTTERDGSLATATSSVANAGWRDVGWRGDALEVAEAVPLSP